MTCMFMPHSERQSSCLPHAFAQALSMISTRRSAKWSSPSRESSLSSIRAPFSELTVRTFAFVKTGRLKESYSNLAADIRLQRGTYMQGCHVMCPSEVCCYVCVVCHGAIPRLTVFQNALNACKCLASNKFPACSQGPSACWTRLRRLPGRITKRPRRGRRGPNLRRSRMWKTTDPGLSRATAVDIHWWLLLPAGASAGRCYMWHTHARQTTRLTARQLASGYMHRACGYTRLLLEAFHGCWNTNDFTLLCAFASLCYQCCFACMSFMGRCCIDKGD